MNEAIEPGRFPYPPVSDRGTHSESRGIAVRNARYVTIPRFGTVPNVTTGNSTRIAPTDCEETREGGNTPAETEGYGEPVAETFPTQFNFCGRPTALWHTRWALRQARPSDDPSASRRVVEVRPGLQHRRPRRRRPRHCHE